MLPSKTELQGGGGAGLFGNLYIRQQRPSGKLYDAKKVVYQRHPRNSRFAAHTSRIGPDFAQMFFDIELMEYTVKTHRSSNPRRC